MATRLRRMLRVTGVAVAAVALIAACEVTADPLEALATPPDSTGSIASAINEHGDVAGLVAHPGAQSGEAARWDGSTGELTLLGPLVDGGRSEAADINDAGVVVGLGTVPHFTYERHHAFVAEPGQAMDDINDDLGSWHTSAATAINNEGIVVGWAVRYLNDEFPQVIATLDFAYDPSTGEVTPLPLSAVDVNDDGVIAGINGNQARTYDLATGTMTSLGSLGGGESRPEAINDSGVVVGQSKTASGEFHGFRYDPADGVMTDVGTLGGNYSIANGVNDNGDVVGESTNESRHQKPFFYWHVNKRMYDLGTIGTVQFLPATDINNDNVVVGYTRETPAIAWRTMVRFGPHDD